MAVVDLPSIPPHEPRTYRQRVQRPGLIGYRVLVRETDLHIQTVTRLATLARELVLTQRGYLEAYIRQHPLFLKSLAPWRLESPACAIVRDMAAAGERCGVGPMAAVAGALAEQVGRGLRPHSREVVVENGGDVFMDLQGPAILGLFAGRSPLSMQVGLRLEGGGKPLGVCTSAGTVGHSLSRGRADAVCVVASSCPLADAAATAIANRVGGAADLTRALEWGRTIEGLRGVVGVVGERMAVWGELEVVPLKANRD